MKSALVFADETLRFAWQRLTAVVTKRAKKKVQACPKAFLPALSP